MTPNVQRLVAIADAAELFRTADARAYATIPVAEHLETWPVRSPQFGEWLQRRNYGDGGELSRQQDIRETTKLIEARCLYDAPTFPVFLRVGECAGRIYLDLGNSDWDLVAVDEQGWQIVSGKDVRVKFRRPRGTQPLPTPVAGGTIDELRPFVNVQREPDWELLISWVMASLRPNGPFPVLSVSGEQGTAKTTAARVMRTVVDPRDSGLRAQPLHLHDLMIAARNSWVLAFDNISSVPAWFSDGLCRLSTGGGFATRCLYSDEEEVLTDAQRPSILNGIGELATRSDLLDRCVNIDLPIIPNSHRRCETELWAAFHNAHPRILGALLDGVSAAMRNLATTNVNNSPRMADFAAWASAAAPGLGWSSETFLAAYQENRATANLTALENSPISASLFALLRRGPWYGTSAMLLKELEKIAGCEAGKKSGWPKNEMVLAHALRRLAPNLRMAGIELAFSKTTNRDRNRMIHLQVSASEPSEPSEESEPGRLTTEAGCAGSDAQRVLDEAQKQLREITQLAKAAGQYGVAVAAQRELIRTTKHMAPGSGVEDFLKVMGAISDEQLNVGQRSDAANSGETSGRGKAASTERGQSA